MKHSLKKAPLFPLLLAFLLIIFGGVFLFSASAWAQSTESGYQLLAPIDTIKASDATKGITLVDYMKGLFVAAIGLAIVLAVVEIVIGGIGYVAAAVPSSKEEAKKRIGGAVGGLLLILLAYVLLQALNPKLLNVGLNLEKVAVVGQEAGSGESKNMCRFNIQSNQQLGGGPYTQTDCDAALGIGQECRQCVGAGVGGVAGRNFKQAYQNVSEKYASQIKTACAQNGAAIPNCESVVAGVIAAESGGREIVSSPAGALGIMQLLPSNGGANCNTDSCVQGQINTGVAQLAQGYNKFGTVPNMLAAYNGGGSVVDGTSPSGRRPAMAESQDCPGMLAWQCDVNPGGLSETKNYVTKICGVVTC
jgi:hypothetical protein